MLCISYYNKDLKFFFFNCMFLKTKKKLYIHKNDLLSHTNCKVKLKKWFTMYLYCTYSQLLFGVQKKICTYYQKYYEELLIIN